MAPRTYEEWVATRFVRDRVYSEEIANVIKDGPLRLPPAREEGVANLHVSADAEYA
jgi:hypothetical protein